LVAGRRFGTLSRMRRFFISLGVTLLVLVTALALVIIFGGPGTPTPMASVNEPFRAVDFSDLPPLAHFTARDGAPLAYRAYPALAIAPGKGSVVLIHGSSASSSSLHVLAKAFAAASFQVYALDMRGHGASGTKGKIGYIGQLEDDVADFMHAVSPAQPSTLVGFSSGGGFAVRFAGSDRQQLFQSYLFLSPFISQDAPTSRPGNGGWVSVGVPRIIALSVLNGFGIHALDDLVVYRFALNDEAKKILTPEYSFALATDFRPLRDYQANLRAMHQPCQVVAGADDEVFYADRFADVFHQAGKDVPVELVPGVDHIQLTLSPVALAAEIHAVENMQKEGPRP
jgi:alpha-beta hydrolase superfamily lysophospholipase